MTSSIRTSITSPLALTLVLFAGLASTPALATHECPAPMTHEECDTCDPSLFDLCFDAAATAYNECAELYAATPFLVEVICLPELSNDNTDCTQHTGAFDHEAALLALYDLGQCSSGGSIDDSCPCDGAWNNHGDYVSCVAQAVNTLVDEGQLAASERKGAVKAAARSTCGK